MMNADDQFRRVESWRPAEGAEKLEWIHREVHHVAPILFAWAFGRPSTEGADRVKVTGTYEFVDAEGHCYNLHDWKQTAGAWPEGTDLPAGFWGRDYGTIQLRGPVVRFEAFSAWLQERLLGELDRRIRAQPSERHELLLLWPYGTWARTPAWIEHTRQHLAASLALAAQHRAAGAHAEELNALYIAESAANKLRGWADVGAEREEAIRLLNRARRWNALRAGRIWEVLWLPERKHYPTSHDQFPWCVSKYR